MEEDAAFVGVHEHNYFHNGAVAETFEEFLDNYNGDKFAVCSKIPGDRSALADNHWKYDEILEEDFEETSSEYGQGHIPDSTAEKLVEEYGKIMLGGGYARAEQCMYNFHDDIQEAADRLNEQTDIEVIPELVFLSYGNDVLSGALYNNVDLENAEQELVENSLEHYNICNMDEALA